MGAGAAMVSFPLDALLWGLALVIQMAGTVGAISMWSSKLTVRVEAIEKQVAAHSDLALAVNELKTTMKRAVTDIEHLMERFAKPQGERQQQAGDYSLAGLPADVLAQLFVNMARGK